jgi:hypothetical protein
MTTTKRFMAWIEFNFWSMAIPLLSESLAVHKLLNRCYRVYEVYQTSKTFKLILWSAAGWCLGLTIGLLGGALLP